MRAVVLFLGAAMAGCVPDRPVQRPPSSRPSSAVQLPSPAAVATLAGEWRVAGIDGQDFNEPYGLALSGSDREIWWSPQCAGFVRSYRLDGIRVRFSPVARPQANDGRPAPSCLIAAPAKLGPVFAAIDAADRVVRTPSNGIEISGGGHSILLFSQ